MRSLAVVMAALCVGMSVFAAEVTMTGTDSASSYSMTSGAQWSDGLAPHSGANYSVSGKSMYVKNNVLGGVSFGGDKLTLNANGKVYFRWSAYPNGGTCWDYPVTFNDLVLTGNSSFLWLWETTSSTNSLARYLVRGKMTVTGVESSYPSLIKLGAVSGIWMYNEMKMVGSSTAYLCCQTQSGGAISSTALVGVDFNGDLSEYNGKLLANTNCAVRIGGAMPGKLLVSGGAAGCSVGSTAPGTGSVGTLEFRRDGYLLATAGCKPLVVTDSFVRNGKTATVRIKDGAESVKDIALQGVLTVPASAQITTDDFGFDNSDSSLSLTVIDNGATLTLAITNSLAGYVRLTGNDQETWDWGYDVATLHKYAFYFEGNWDDGLKPTADKDYYVGPEYGIYLVNFTEPAKQREKEEGESQVGNAVFRGGSLTVGGWAIVNSYQDSVAYSVTIPDFRLLNNSRITYTRKSHGVTTKQQAFGYSRSTQISILARKATPTIFEGGKTGSGFNFMAYTKFIGDEDAGIRLIGSTVETGGTAVTAFHGDMSEYLGTISVGRNHTMYLGKSMPGTVEVLDEAGAGFSLTNTTSSITIGRLVAHKAVSVRVPAGVSLAIGEADYEGTVNFVCSDFTAGRIVAGKGATASNVTLNGQPVKVFNGALYLNDVSELGIEGSGTAEDPYIADTAEHRAILNGVDGAVISTLPSSAVPLKGANNSSAKTAYINTYRGYFVDNYNSATGVDFSPDSSGRAYCEAGLYTKNAVDYTFWSDEVAPHEGADYVVFPEIWGSSTYSRDFVVVGDAGAFAGDSLTLAEQVYLKFNSANTDATIGTLVMLPDSVIDQNNAHESHDYLRGNVYLRGTEGHPVQIRCFKNYSTFEFPGIVASTPDTVLSISTYGQNSGVDFTGNLGGFKGTISMGEKTILRLDATAPSATVSFAEGSKGLTIQQAVTLKSLTLVQDNWMLIKAPFKITDDFTHVGQTTVDLSGFAPETDGTVVLELPEGDAIGVGEFAFTNVPDGKTVVLSGNKAMLSSGLPPLPTKSGAVILFR